MESKNKYFTFKNGSYIYMLPISRGSTKRTLKICKEEHPVEFGSDEYYNALLNVLENVFRLNGVNNEV